MRLASKGQFFWFPDIIPARRGSFITLALMRSRAAREGNMIQENTVVSPRLSLTPSGNDVRLPTFTSSVTHSVKERAPCPIQILPALRAIFLYSDSRRRGTGTTNPST
jgi:hypothetical protein